MTETGIVIPGGITDMHIHAREPGAEHKEDFAHATRAALAGGVAAVFDMVNNPGHETKDMVQVRDKIRRAERTVYSDIGFYYRYQPGDNNESSFKYAARYAFGLKSMLEISTGSDQQTSAAEFHHGWKAWHEVASMHQPIILHAETATIDEALATAAGRLGHATHVAHVSNRAELESVMAAKRRGWPVTCGVTPHHMFMDQSDVVDWFQRMKPPLAAAEDVEFLWHHLDAIDVFETDHAPHTRDEKAFANQVNPEADEQGTIKSYGVPGLEAMVPLFFTALNPGSLRTSERFVGKKITGKQLYDKLVVRPHQILNLPASGSTSTRVEFGETQFGDNLQTKCGWSPYSGWLLNARVVSVDLRGTTVYRNGEFRNLAKPAGQVLVPAER